MTEDVKSIRTTIEGHVYVGEVIPAATFLKILAGMSESLGLAFEIMAERFEFKLEAAMNQSIDLPDNYLCWFRIFDTLAYCRVMNYAVSSHFELDPAYTITMSQNDVDAVNIAAQLLTKAAEYLNLPPATVVIPAVTSLN